MTAPVSDEQNAQILYDFATGKVIPMLKPEGVWIGPDPWPLPSQIIEREFKRISEHESYERQTIICKSGEDGGVITLAEGVVKVDGRERA